MMMSNLSLEDDLRNIAFGIVLEDVAASNLDRTDIGQGWHFRKASPDEALICRVVVGNINSLLHTHDIYTRPQELDFIPFDGGTGFTAPKLCNANEWRYCVVAPSENTSLRTHQVTEALRISNAELTVEHWGIKWMEYDGVQSPISVPYPTFNFSMHKSKPNNIDFDEVRECINLRGELDEDRFKPIAIALDRFRSLGGLPRSDMKLLGYFGVVEALLSHAPKPNDSADSISRQLKRNLVLIENRLPENEKIGLSLEDGTKVSTIISKLYGFRSDLAHGNTSTSSKDWLAKNMTKEVGVKLEIFLDDFLRRLVRRVLKQALREPQLITDLKG